MIHKLGYLLIAIVIFTSCNDDFSINGEWEDITIVYGLLNSSDSIQYIKINKAFLGEGDVYEMASIPDSIQYKNELDVKLIEYKLINQDITPYNPDNWEITSREPIILTRTDEIPKDDGIFGNDVNYLYKTTEKILDGFKYILEITNPETGKIIWSETYMIYKFRLLVPRNIPTLKINMANETSVFTTEWESAVYGKVYQPSIRFHYLEVLGKDTTKHEINLFYNSQATKVVRVPGMAAFNMRQNMGGTEFYDKIADNIEENPNVIRIPLKLDFVYYMGGQNFATYLNVSESSESFGQTESFYTNIKNGKGIFDCRSVYSLKGKELNNASLDSLHRGRFTKHLNFMNYTIDYEY